MSTSGRCLCGEIVFEYEGSELWRGHCHCESCRRQTASPLTTFMGVSNERWRWLAQVPKVYQSSHDVRRYFCANCGSPVAYESDRFPDEIHFYASLLDNHSNFIPDQHYHWEERVSWLCVEDNLPRSQ